ncbi:MAG: hypothetical protein H9Q65_02535 [Spiroplasma ixodetis]|nr:hypothetical protein [Spiroplasma ixodetis]MBP1526955.1 hypothetical protein [Spiroplasma ixodetis]MBP1528115.1 hypothetical protein [Spiroplasma ixodetis]
MTKEEADQIAELFKCDECASSFRVSEDFEKGYFIPCEKHQGIANLNYFKKMNIH